MPDLVVLITGGTSGIGNATARAALAAGHRVCITGRDPDRVARAIAGLGAGDRALGCAADAADWSSTERAVEAAVARFGRLDVAVANAGFEVFSDFIEADPDEWRQMVLTNVLGPALLAKAALPELVKTQGRLILLGSVTGRKALPSNLYPATKWAITGMGESIRLQMIGTGVRVCVVEPGIVKTPFWPQTPEAGLDPEDVAGLIVWSLDLPPHVDVNELLVRPTGQPV
jgi:NADP-dependent 3-hydroxy acid dehydrogenase YdfG